jgi:hypothetical protein
VGGEGLYSLQRVDVKASCSEDNSEAQRAYLWKWADSEGNVPYQSLDFAG